MTPFSPGRLAQLACILEATARKPGNVHRYADFDDCTYLDFLLSAAAIVEPLDRAGTIGVGAAVFEAVAATRQVVASNTNLGLILLLAPLAAAVPHVAPRSGPAGLRAAVSAVCSNLTVQDAEHVYDAIRTARPGGLGRIDQQDVAAPPTVTLREAMALASNRDLIALQYTNGFNDLFDLAWPALRDALDRETALEAAIIAGFLTILARHPDALIARKRGRAVAEEAARRAAVLVAARCFDPSSAPLRAFDAWLRADGHARNPGTTADLTAAAIFVALYDGAISLPWQGPFAHDPATQDT